MWVAGAVSAPDPGAELRSASQTTSGAASRGKASSSSQGAGELL